MIKVICIVALFVCALAQRAPIADEAPKPFAFDYAAKVGGEGEVAGSLSANAVGDAQGRVEGSYSFEIEDGRRRVVSYVADKDGFRANVQTNEQGTKPESPADAVFTALKRKK
ncbi:cuticle protein 10.9-like [Centruroides vittatus]|uniref:cuticle protein 10.9-like n=1 Tax=Centruroides vittatus TaxID=120091 RepID=UPI00351005E2